MFLRLILFLTFWTISGCQLQNPEESIDTIQPNEVENVVKNGMVVSAHPLASQVGLDILKTGGNAVDAAIAIQFALAVVYPSAGNLGGGGFMVYRKSNGKSFALDFREQAPAGAERDMFLDKNGNVIKGKSLNTRLAVGVPGTVDGIFQAYERFASLPFEQLINPAIELARNGFQLTEKESKKLEFVKEILKERNGDNPYVKEKSWKAGDTLKLQELRQTLEWIRKNKRAGFYAGETADNIIKEMNSGNGIISLSDLKNYSSVWRKPVTGSYKNFRIVSMCPPSSGGIALIQLLKMVENFPIAAWGWNDTKTIHLMTEAERRVYADRAKHLGDADFYGVPVEQLLDSGYIASRMKDFDPNKATPSDDVEAGEPVFESEETTHFSVVDRFGNAVAVTTTLNASFGSKILVKGSGFFLNNEMDDFSVKPGVPNLYGLVGAEANSIEAGKRMLSSMTPTIIEKDGKLFMALGTPGGSTIITSVFQTFLNVVEHEMSIQEAVNEKRVHHQWLPDKIFYEENALHSKVMESLEAYGHSVQKRSSIGRVDAILVHPDGSLEGGADTRGDDSAMGF